MGTISGLSQGAKLAIGAAIALLVWAILGIGIGLFELYNSTTTGIPSTVLTVGRTGVAIGASLSVMLSFFD